MAEPATVNFRAMGSPCRVVVNPSAEGCATRARDLILALEQKWSRFLDHSEVSAINRAAGQVTVVSEETFSLVERAASAVAATGGLFNPLMLEQLERQGYRRPWNNGVPLPTGEPISPGRTEEIVIYPEPGAIRLPEGTRFDPGGIGKGLAIDMATDLCISEGAGTVLVELGGDLRVHGVPWYGPEWTIGVSDPFDPAVDTSTFTLDGGGAVTTSTTEKRCWRANGRRYHHLLDPTTGEPSASDLVSVTTCSSLAWWAEVMAKSALIAGSSTGPALLEWQQTPGFLVTNTGATISTGASVSTGPTGSMTPPSMAKSSTAMAG